MEGYQYQEFREKRDQCTLRGNTQKASSTLPGTEQELYTVFITIIVAISNNCCKNSTKNSQRPMAKLFQMWMFYSCFQCIWYAYSPRPTAMPLYPKYFIVSLSKQETLLQNHTSHQTLEMNIYTMLLSNLQTLFWILSFVLIMSLIAEIQDDALPCLYLCQCGLMNTY